MRRITAVFDNRDQADYAKRLLLIAGIENDAIVLVEGCDSVGGPHLPDAEALEAGNYTIADDMQNLFKRMFMSSEEAQQQVAWEAVNAGKVVLEVDTETEEDFEIAFDTIDDLRFGWTNFN
jgi:hypothetical protein